MFQGDVKRFASEDMVGADGEKLKVPHMGWNQVYQVHDADGQVHPLWHGIEDGARFYYVHSYYVQPADAAVIAGYSEYPNKFTSWDGIKPFSTIT